MPDLSTISAAEIAELKEQLTRLVREKEELQLDAQEELREARNGLETKVAERTAELSGIIEGTFSPVFALDGDLRYVAFNRSHASAMRALYGAEIEVGRRMLDYVTVAGDREKARRNLERALAGERLLESTLSGKEHGPRRYFEVSYHPVRSADGQVIGVAVFANDITERRRAEGRLRKEAERGALFLDVFLRSPQLSEKQIYDDVLELAARLTESTIGFLHRVSEDQKSVNLTTWSRATLESCSVVHDTHYPIDRAGNWVDSVRLGRPVIYNDFAASPNQKGLPPGHAPLRRFMSVPVREGDRVRIVFGVGNKAEEYDEDDVFQVEQIANELQKVIRQRHAAKRVELLGRLYRAISEMNQAIGREKSRDRLFAEVCRIGVEHGGFAMVWAGLADVPGGLVRPIASAGVETSFADELAVRLDVPPAELRPAARAVVEDRSVVVEDTGTDPGFGPWREAAERHGFRSCAAFPVRVDGAASAVLAVYAGETGMLHGEVTALLSELAAELGFALGSIEADHRRTRAEKALHAERGLLVGGPTVAFSWKDQEGWPVEYVSPNVADQFGYAPEDFTSGDVPYASIVHPDDLRRVGAEVSDFSERGVPSFERVYRIARADGCYRWIRDFTTVHRERNGAVAGYHGYVLDITEQVQAEEELVRVNRALRMLSGSKQADREWQTHRVQPRQNLEDAVAAIAATVEAPDSYTAGHQRRVAALAAGMAKELGLAEEAVQGIHLAGTIHDLGKIKIPAAILARPGELSEIDTRLIQIHPEVGWEILKGVELPWPIAEMVLEHHERLDGSGYPKGLRGEQISQGARIIAVADVVEAMASDRPYRPPRGLNAALSQIEGDRAVLFDAAAVDACLALFRVQGYRLED